MDRRVIQNNYTIIVFGVLLLFFCFYPAIDGRLIYEGFIGLVFLIFILFNELSKKVHLSVGIAVAILLISGMYSFAFPETYPIPVNPMLIAKGGAEIMYSVVSVILFSIALLLNSKEFFRKILDFIYYAAVIDSVILIFNCLFLKQQHPYAMLNNGSADASFIACMLPMYISKKNSSTLALIVMLAAIMLCKSNTALAGAGVAAAMTLLPNMEFKNWIKLMIPVTAMITLCSVYILGDHFMADSGRRFVWEGSFAFYKQFANPWFGLGTGTFTLWGDAWQRAHYLNSKTTYSVWNWLHNEPLEILFENGILGLVSTLVVYGLILKRTFKKSVAFPIACVYGVISLTEMPLRLFVTQMVGICLVSEAFLKPARKKRKTATP